MLHEFHQLAMLSESEKQFLFGVSKNLLEDSVVLEVGTNKGGSCSIIAGANPLIKIHTLDLFEDLNNSHEIVSRRLSCFSNVNVYKGNSFVHFKDWVTPIDVYFEDGAHEDPALSYSLEQWLPHLKIQGTLLIHDNSKYFPDVGKNVKQLVDSGEFEFVNQIDSLTVLKKLG